MGKIDRRRVHWKFDGHCAYCGVEVDFKDFQVDHIHAQWHRGTDDFDNLNPSCRSCNNAKYTFSIEQFRAELIKAIEVQRRNNARFRLLERFGIIKQVKTDIAFYFEQCNEK